MKLLTSEVNLMTQFFQRSLYLRVKKAAKANELFSTTTFPLSMN